MINHELLAQAIVALGNEQDERDWTTEFNWHRAEFDIDKARAAAEVYIRRYEALVADIDPNDVTGIIVLSKDITHEQFDLFRQAWLDGTPDQRRELLRSTGAIFREVDSA